MKTHIKMNPNAKKYEDLFPKNHAREAAEARTAKSMTNTADDRARQVAPIGQVLAGLRRDLEFVSKYGAEEQARRHEMLSISSDEALDKVIETGDPSAVADFDTMRRKHEVAKAAYDHAQKRWRKNAAAVAAHIMDLSEKLEGVFQVQRALIIERLMPQVEKLFPKELAGSWVLKTSEMIDQRFFEASYNIGKPSMRTGDAPGSLVPDDGVTADAFHNCVTRLESAIADAEKRTTAIERRAQ